MQIHLFFYPDTSECNCISDSIDAPSESPAADVVRWLSVWFDNGTAWVQISDCQTAHLPGPRFPSLQVAEQ